MDSIDRINNYRMREIYPKSIVLLKKGISSNITTSYVIVPSEHYITEKINKEKQLHESIIELLIKDNFIKDKSEIKEINFCGDLSLFSGHHVVVSKLPHRRIDVMRGIDIHYRNYTKTPQQQKDLLPLNIARTTKDSWLSGVKKCGSKYGVLLKLIQVENVKP